MPFDASGLITESIIWLNTKTLDVPTAIALGGWLAGKVNTVQGLSGAEKQALVCRVVEEVVERQMPEGDAKDGLLAALKIALPAALTLAVDAARGRLSLKKIEPGCVLGWLSCFARGAVDVAVAARVEVPVAVKDAVKTVEVVTEKAEEVMEKVKALEAPVEAALAAVSPDAAAAVHEAVDAAEVAVEAASATVEVAVAAIAPVMEETRDSEVAEPLESVPEHLPASEPSSETEPDAAPQSEESAPELPIPVPEIPVNPEPVKVASRARKSKKVSAN